MDQYSALEELLSFIERHFAKYFDQDAKAPESYIAIAKKDAAEKLHTIELRLNERQAGGRISYIVLYS